MLTILWHFVYNYEQKVRSYLQYTRCVLRWEFIKENKKTRFQPRKRSRKKKKVRKHALNQESDQEEKKNNFFLFVFDHFLGRELVFFLFSYFLVFFYKFSPQQSSPILAFTCHETIKFGQ